MSEITIKYTPLSEIEGWPRNPKLHDDAGISLSIIEHGFNDPPAVDERSGRLVEGHGRIDTLRAMKAAGESPPDRVSVRDDGEWMVPVLRGISFESDEHAQAYLLAHNRLTERGGWNEQELQLVLQDLMDESVDVLATSGFSVEELDSLTEAVLGAAGAVGTGGGGNVAPPDDFRDIDPDAALDYQCPKCGYEWNGTPR
jgi:hypothetical protein